MFDGPSGSSYSFRREPFADAIIDGMPALRRQWDETGETAAGPFSLALERYEASDRAGALRIYTVRRYGEFVGYAAYFLFVGMHAAAKVAVSDAFWLDPAHRRPGVAMRLLRFVEASLRSDQVILIHTSVNADHDTAGRLLGYLGYKLESHTYAKVLKYA